MTFLAELQLNKSCELIWLVSYWCYLSSPSEKHALRGIGFSRGFLAGRIFINHDLRQKI